MAATYVKAYEFIQIGTSGLEFARVLPVSNPDGGGREWFLANSPHRFAFEVDPPAATPAPAVSMDDEAIS
jgi:hypothetical protein